MSAINFPSSPSNGQTLVTNDAVYTYNSAKGYWDGVSTLTGIQLASISVGANAPASGDGGLAYNSASGVFTYTPPVSADPLPAQTGNTGKYLTTDGSTTSWAEVASGGGLSFIQDFTASGSITANTPVVLNSTGTVSTLGEVGEGSTAVNYGFQYSEDESNDPGNGISYSAATDQFIVYQYPGKLKVGKFTSFPEGGIQWGDTITLSNQGLSGNFATFRARSVYDSTLDRDLTVVYRADNDKIGFYQGSTSLGTYNYSAGTYTETSELHSQSFYQWGPQFAPVSVGAGKVLFMYRAKYSNNPTINIATTSLNQPFTFGSPVTLSGQTYANQTTCGLAYSETAGVAYALYVDGGNLKYAIINVNGSSPVIESTHIVQAGIANPSYVGGIAIKDNYVVVTYVDRQASGANIAKVVGGYIDSATKQITLGIAQEVSTSDIGRGGLTVVPTKFNNFAVLRTEINTYILSNYSVATDGGLTNIQSTTVTTDSTYVSQSGMYNLVFSPISNNLVVDFYVETGTSYGITGHRTYQFTHKAETLGPVVSNADRFLGFATTSVADAATVPVTLVGVQGGLSGLTPATDYYVTGTGSLSSGDTGYRKVGTALSSSSILMDDSSNVIGYATTSYVDTAINNLVDSSPAALNTLNELAAALGDDANFATTVTNTLAEKAPLASPTFTGVPVAPTATAGNASTQIATTAFVAAATAAAAGDTLPAQTDNAGKYLTTDGSTTSWAEVAAGAGYEIGDGLELNSVTTIDWSTLPSPLTEINGIASEQYFGGIGLSASDTHIVIGTPGGAGAVTAFDVYSAETGAFLRSIEKIDPAALGDGGFGAFVSISGTKVIMGHPLAASVAGAAYIFEATTGALLHTLPAPTGGAATTGQAVAISPNYAAVLSLTSAQTSSRIGVYNVSTGALLHTIAQVTNGNGHGSLSITDQYLVAGEPLRDRDGQPTSDNSGAVSVYDTATGSLLHTIVEPTPSVSGDFGFSVSVHGDYIAIGGAPGTYGAVYVYSASTGGLLHTFQNPLPAETGTTYTYGFGKSISVYGGYLLVGALDGPKPGTIGDSWGRAYLYDLTNGILIQTISGTNNNDQLGDSVAIGPGIIAIGVPQYDSNGLTNNGKAVIYKTDVTTADYLQPDSTIATTSSPTFTGVTTLTATSEVLQPKFSAGFGAVDHDIANGSIFYHDNMMGNFDAAFINVPTTVDLVTSAVLVMADGQMWGPSSYVRVNGTEYVVKWLGGTAPTMSADVVDVVSYSLINRNGTWVVIGSHSAYSAAV